MGKRFSWRPKHTKLSSALFFCIALLSACNSNFFSSQSGDQLPNTIAQSFLLHYPNTKIEGFKKENEAFVIHFINDSKQCDASFSADGKWIESITKIKWTSQLPSEIKKTFDKTQYASWNVSSINKYQFPKDSCFSLAVNNGNLLDADHHDSFLKNCCLSIRYNGVVDIQDRQ